MASPDAHECPEDPAAFFAQLERLFSFCLIGEPPPEGYVECRVCGGHYKLAAEAEKSP